MNKKYYKELHLSHKSTAINYQYSSCCGRLSVTRTPFSPTRKRSGSTTSMATRRLLPAQGMDSICLLHAPFYILLVLFYGCSSFMQSCLDPVSLNPDPMTKNIYLWSFLPSWIRIRIANPDTDSIESGSTALLS